MVLSDVEETVTIVEAEEDNVDPAVRVILLSSHNEARACEAWCCCSGHYTDKQTVKKRSDMLFVRGDSVIMLSPGGGDRR
jgi:small nuclear ribonucleoprotein (snRNP)-like protein